METEKKVKRSPNFSSTEISVLTQGVEEKKDILFSKMNNSLTNAVKKRAWETITNRINEVNATYTRSVDEVKKKWSALQSSTKKKVSFNRREMKRTGGGPPPTEIPVIVDKISGIIGDTCIEGVQGGLDTLEENSTREDSRSSDKTEETASTSEVPVNLCVTEDLTSTIRKRKKKDVVSDTEASCLVDIERERLQVEKERLEVEKSRPKVEEERLQIEKQNLKLNQEKHMLYLHQLGIQQLQFVVADGSSSNQTQ